MVASRKPKHAAGRRRESMEQKFQRIMREPVDAPIKMTQREARYFARRLWETGNPKSPSGEEVMRDFYGRCVCDDCSHPEPNSH
jgi:hypothetical protein